MWHSEHSKTSFLSWTETNTKCRLPRLLYLITRTNYIRKVRLLNQNLIWFRYPDPVNETLLYLLIQHFSFALLNDWWSQFLPIRMCILSFLTLMNLSSHCWHSIVAIFCEKNNTKSFKYISGRDFFFCQQHDHFYHEIDLFI